MLMQRLVVDEKKEERYRMLREFADAMSNLGRCLRDSGALCRAWELGQDSHPCDGPWVHASETHIARSGSWFPGCQQQAPDGNEIWPTHSEPESP